MTLTDFVNYDKCTSWNRDRKTTQILNFLLWNYQTLTYLIQPTIHISTMHSPTVHSPTIYRPTIHTYHIWPTHTSQTPPTHEHQFEAVCDGHWQWRQSSNVFYSFCFKNNLKELKGNGKNVRLLELEISDEIGRDLGMFANVRVAIDAKIGR